MTTNHRTPIIPRARRLLVASIGALGIVGIAVGSAWAAGPSVSLTTNAKEGFQFQSADHGTVGYIYSLKLGSTQIPAAFGLATPARPGRSDVVGVITQAAWGDTAFSAIVLSVDVSPTARTAIVSAERTAAGKPLAASFTFTVFSVNLTAKTSYYAAFGGPSGKTLQGLVQVGNLTVSGSPNTNVTSPQNYLVSVQIQPTTSPQVLDIGTPTPVAENWG